MQRESTMAAMVVQVATAVARSTQLSELADAVLDVTARVLGATASSLFVVEFPRRELRLLGQSCAAGAVMPRTISLDSPGVLGRVARMRTREIVEDVRAATDEPAAFQKFLACADARRLIGVPLVAADVLVGVLAYSLPAEQTAPPAEDLAMVDAVAAIVAVGLAGALAQHRLASEHARLAAIFEHAPHGIVHLDVTERVATHNPAAARLLGSPPPDRWEPWDRSPNQVYRPDGTPLTAEEEPGRRALRGETVLHDEVLVDTADGAKRPFIVSAAPVTGPNHTIESVVLAFEDISALKELDRLRAEFAAIVTHDLRTPISAILMTAELMLRHAAAGGDVVVHAAAVERIRTSAARLGDMVNDLLDASRLEIGRLTLDRRSVDAVEAIQQLVSRIQPSLGEHWIDIARDGDRMTIAADPLRFDQIFTNLLENAAKYSTPGSSIVVRVHKHDGGVELSVIDRGYGIPPDELPLLFDRFYQARRARTTHKGLGLGLYITKGLVEAHGGRIHAESEVGQGSTFHVWLPLERSEDVHR
jgi:PAS domain S-box-containing protein